MNLHIIGGFLGSGKTTAIISATKSLLEKGKRVGVITNDKGKNLVDTAFIAAQNIPTGEVPGGCFRCSFDELQKQVDILKTKENPDIIFAESVGSCADMVATVIQPLLELKEAADGFVSFSVFTDIRLFQRWLNEEELPFSEEVVYIFEKQIEEADILILNKSDLIPQEETAQILEKAKKRFPEKRLLLQNSLTPAGTQAWLELIESTDSTALRTPLDMDYSIYDKGSRQLGWLDEKISITCPAGQAGEISVCFLKHCSDQLRRENIPIAHLKFFIRAGKEQAKISFTSLEENRPEIILPDLEGNKVQILINGRIQTAPARIDRLIRTAIETCSQEQGIKFTRAESAYFRPRIIKQRS